MFFYQYQVISRRMINYFERYDLRIMITQNVWTIFHRFQDSSTISLELAQLYPPNFRNIFIGCTPFKKIGQLFEKLWPLNYDYAKHTKVFNFHISKTFYRYLWYSPNYIHQTFSASLLDVFLPISSHFKKIGQLLEK